jgi:hypothetical protein
VVVVLFLSFIPLDSVIRRIPRGGRSYQEWRLLGFLALSFLLGLGVNTIGSRVRVVLGLAVMVAGVELFQHWTPSHHSSFREFVGSVLATVSGVALATLTTRRLDRFGVDLRSEKVVATGEQKDEAA